MSYHGWKNYETWNVALWISNDEGLYSITRECRNYGEFVERVRALAGAENSLIAVETPDHVAWNDSGLDHAALDELICEFRND